MKVTVRIPQNTLRRAKFMLFIGLMVLSTMSSSVQLQENSRIEFAGSLATTERSLSSLDTKVKEVKRIEIDYTREVTVTSYNSEPGQTDDTPFITAYNTRVRDGIVAANFLPKDTMIRFPDYFGNKIFVVEDRMNRRYPNRVDIWSADHDFSIQFGVQVLKMEILRIATNQ